MFPIVQNIDDDADYPDLQLKSGPKLKRKQQYKSPKNELSNSKRFKMYVKSQIPGTLAARNSKQEQF